MTESPLVLQVDTGNDGSLADARTQPVAETPIVSGHTPGPWEWARSFGGHTIRMGAACISGAAYDSHLRVDYDHGCYPDVSEAEAEQFLEAEASARKAASAKIAKIPLTLSRHIARTYFPAAPQHQEAA